MYNDLIINIINIKSWVAKVSEILCVDYNSSEAGEREQGLHILYAISLMQGQRGICVTILVKSSSS